jgi:saccharopine dehydrogenase (NAD+, L-lysine-forming)
MAVKIGIIAEHKPGEGRIPLTPLQISQLHRDHPDLTISVMPSEQRIFRDDEFLESDIPMSQDLSDANLVMAVKEIDVKDIRGNQAYLYFSHTIKGQAYNMPMLQHILDTGATLLDYELIRDDNNRRLVFFGRHAGLAGMVNTLWAYGQRLKVLGTESPFLQIKQAQDYANLEEINLSLQILGSEISRWMADKPALVIGLTGYGNVSRGAQEILANLPMHELSARELLEADLDDFHGQLIKVVFKEEDMFEPREASNEFLLQDYFDHPEKYQAKFQPYLKKLHMLVNCIYWDTPYPRLVTIEDIKTHYQSDKTLMVVGDITCDIDGAIQFNTGSTLSPDPVYIHDIQTGKKVMGFVGEGPVVMAVDNLPTELPREASEAFGEALIPFVYDMGACDYVKPFEQLDLPAEVKRAVIAHAGELTPEHEHLKIYLKA